MERVSVVGVAGSGKTSLAAALGERLGVPVTELDSIVWTGTDWQPVAADELRERFDQISNGDRWVIDGYYGELTETAIWPRADTVVWLDLPRRLVLVQAARRSVRRIVRREELWGGNRESLRDLVSWDPQRSVLRWIWIQHGVRRQQFLAASIDPKWADTDFIRLRARPEIRAFLSAVERRAEETGPG